jgi:hypothetical protein
VLPAAIFIFETVFGESCTKELSKNPLADNTSRRIISDIAEYLYDLLIVQPQTTCLHSRSNRCD